jgi:hypothetical protein
MFYTTPDDVETVAEFYEGALEAAGWSQTMSNEMAGMAMSTWQKENRALTLMINAEDTGGSSVTLTEGVGQ